MRGRARAIDLVDFRMWLQSQRRIHWPRIFSLNTMHNASRKRESIEDVVCTSFAAFSTDNANRDPVQARWQGAYKIDDSELDSRQSCESRARERTLLDSRRCGAMWGEKPGGKVTRAQLHWVTIFFPFLPSRRGRHIIASDRNDGVDCAGSAILERRTYNDRDRISHDWIRLFAATRENGADPRSA